jgi:hypothetical protein
LKPLLLQAMFGVMGVDWARTIDGAVDRVHPITLIVANICFNINVTSFLV